MATTATLAPAMVARPRLMIPPYTPPKLGTAPFAPSRISPVVPGLATTPTSLAASLAAAAAQAQAQAQQQAATAAAAAGAADDDEGGGGGSDDGSDDSGGGEDDGGGDDEGTGGDMQQQHGAGTALAPAGFSAPAPAGWRWTHAAALGGAVLIFGAIVWFLFFRKPDGDGDD